MLEENNIRSKKSFYFFRAKTNKLGSKIKLKTIRLSLIAVGCSNSIKIAYEIPQITPAIVNEMPNISIILKLDSA